MNRRRAMFWMGLGLFSLAERLRADVLDDLAAKAMDSVAAGGSPAGPPIHWRTAENNTWRWFEQEKFVDGKWQVSGITTPIHKLTGEPYTGHTGYLDPSTVPVSVRGEDDANETPETIADHDFAHHAPAWPAVPVTVVRPAGGCAACTPTSCGFGSKRSTCPRPVSKE